MFLKDCDFDTMPPHMPGSPAGNPVTTEAEEDGTPKVIAMPVPGTQYFFPANMGPVAVSIPHLPHTAAYNGYMSPMSLSPGTTCSMPGSPYRYNVLSPPHVAPHPMYPAGVYSGQGEFVVPSMATDGTTYFFKPPVAPMMTGSQPPSNCTSGMSSPALPHPVAMPLVGSDVSNPSSGCSTPGAQPLNASHKESVTTQ